MVRERYSLEPHKPVPQCVQVRDSFDQTQAIPGEGRNYLIHSLNPTFRTRLLHLESLPCSTTGPRSAHTVCQDGSVYICHWPEMPGQASARMLSPNEASGIAVWLVRDRAPNPHLLKGNVSAPFLVYSGCFSNAPDLLGYQGTASPLPGTVFTEHQDCPALGSGALLSPASHPPLLPHCLCLDRRMKR